MICIDWIDLSEFVVYTGTGSLVPGQQGGCGNVSRMPGICLYVGHGGDDCGEHHIPLFCRVFIDAYFHGNEHVYFFGECHEGFLEPIGYIVPFVGCA